ncbi:P27 family phage terminase small subunit [Clostridium sp. CF012]|uniref:P27 family phage terminase small subunit n=1 Tax=Clostridium sp. CF012 TaxID=2843319 RepID=UPI001C0B149E|nr:P27 family phage terminase small subunit [Clostridium sp. CF012]MBU3145735.1 P27 family phage terminase small subunit [Clostridium sp. CF012]
MAGRNGKSINLHIAEGNPSHLTKAEIKHRKESEMQIGSSTIKCPSYIKENINAYIKWKEIIKLYKDTKIISSGDITFLARYCMAFSEYIELLERKKRINHISENCDDLIDYIENSDEFDFRIQKQLKDMVSTEAILKIDTAINKKMDLLIKMEDRSFLNPLAKVKNIPKAPEEKPTNKFDKFGSRNG